MKFIFLTLIVSMFVLSCESSKNTTSQDPTGEVLVDFSDMDDAGMMHYFCDSLPDGIAFEDGFFSETSDTMTYHYPYQITLNMTDGVDTISAQILLAE